MFDLEFIYFVVNFVKRLIIYRNMELQTTQSNVKLDSARRGDQNSSRFKSRKTLEGRRNGQIRQKTILQIREDLLKKFQQFSIAQSFAKIYNVFRNTIGRHSVIKYEKQYNFKQQWQFSKRQENKQDYPINIFYGFLNFLILITLNLCIWGVSVKTFFQIQDSQWVYYVVSIISAIKIINNLPRIKLVQTKSKIRMVYKQILCIVISILLSLTHPLIIELKILSMVVIILLYLKATKVYKHIKIFYISSKHREIVDIIDLFVLLLSIAHFFALLLYAITHLDHNINWMLNINIQNQSWITKYIYSLYFSCTTMLTVGYGDISPTNIAQILTILATQLIGIATFAYAVNKIGICLTNITQRTQKLQKDLGNVQYIGNQYKLKPQIICRMRKQLIQQKNNDLQLNISSQTQLFKNFSEDLRQQIQQERSMRVIKRSMFMIGSWTGKLQFKVARRLIKQIYAIDQSLPQNPGKQKIYILDKGKIDVINNSRSGFKKCFQKILKTIQVKSNTEVVVQNVYGFSAVVSDRHIRLNAIAKQNSICYSLLKSDLFQLLAQSEQDLQYFHELKSKINLSKIPQQIEAPSIINFREHYCPSVLYIISQNYKRQYIKNKRQSVLRKKRRVNLAILDQCNIKASITDKKQRSRFYPNNFRAEQISGFIKVQESQQFKTAKYLDEIKSEPFSQIQIFGFQSSKQYQRYFKRSNYENVLNCMKKKIYGGKIFYLYKTIKSQNPQL